MSDIFSEDLEMFVSESNELIDDIEKHFLAMKPEEGWLEEANAAFRSLHTLKGNAGVCGITRLVEVCHEGETVLTRLIDSQIELSPELVDSFMERIDKLRDIIEKL